MGDLEAANCGGCRFSVPQFVDFSHTGERTPTPVLECRRYPPLMVQVGEPLPDIGAPPMMAMWTQVDGGDWCGEFQPDGEAE